MLVSKEFSTPALLLKLTKPANPADQWIEDGLYSLLTSSSSRRPGSLLLNRRRVTSFASPHLGPTGLHQHHSLRKRMEACMTFGRAALRLLLHFIKGLAVGSGAYAMDYFLVNEYHRRLLQAISAFICGNSDAEDIKLLP